MTSLAMNAKRSKKPFPVSGEYRLCVYKSAKHIEAQIIDDFNQTTLVAASSKEKAFSKEKVNKSELASLVGKSLSERAKAKKVKKFVEVGDKVKKGQTIMIVEAMKTMNHIPSTEDGEVKRILVEDGQPVEFGQTLILLK